MAIAAWSGVVGIIIAAIHFGTARMEKSDSLRIMLRTFAWCLPFVPTMLWGAWTAVPLPASMVIAGGLIWPNLYGNEKQTENQIVWAAAFFAIIWGIITLIRIYRADRK